MRLLTVELTRLRWRRAVVVLLAASVVLPALLFAGLAWNTRPVSDAEIRDAKDIVARNAEMNDQQIKDCIASPSDFGISPTDDPATTCPQIFGFGEDSYENYLYRQPLDVGDEREGTGLGVISILVVLVMLIGTTFAGHDWNSGSMSNQLLFEPRRPRVWGAKAGAVFVTGLVVAAVVLAAFWGLVWLLAGARDVQGTGHEWELIRNSSLRATLLIAGAGVGGYALTMFFRSTVATLGIMFAVAVVGQAVVAAVLGDASVRWLVPTNIAAFLFNGFDYYDGSDGCVSTGEGMVECGGGTAHLGLAAGTTYLGVLLLVAVALSVWSFRRRDVP